MQFIRDFTIDERTLPMPDFKDALTRQGFLATRDGALEAIREASDAGRSPKSLHPATWAMWSEQDRERMDDVNICLKADTRNFIFEITLADPAATDYAVSRVAVSRRLIASYHKSYKEYIEGLLPTVRRDTNYYAAFDWQRHGEHRDSSEALGEIFKEQGWEVSMQLLRRFFTLCALLRDCPTPRPSQQKECGLR